MADDYPPDELAERRARGDEATAKAAAIRVMAGDDHTEECPGCNRVDATWNAGLVIWCVRCNQPFLSTKPRE